MSAYLAGLAPSLQPNVLYEQMPVLQLLFLLSSNASTTIARIESHLRILLQRLLCNPGLMLINRALHSNFQPDL